MNWVNNEFSKKIFFQDLRLYVSSLNQTQITYKLFLGIIVAFRISKKSSRWSKTHPAQLWIKTRLTRAEPAPDSLKIVAKLFTSTAKLFLY